MLRRGSFVVFFDGLGYRTLFYEKGWIEQGILKLARGFTSIKANRALAQATRSRCDLPQLSRPSEDSQHIMIQFSISNCQIDRPKQTGSSYHSLYTTDLKQCVGVQLQLVSRNYIGRVKISKQIRNNPL